MQFSLRTLMVAAVLTALLASAIAMRLEEQSLKIKAVDLETESQELKAEIAPSRVPLEEIEKYYQRIFDSVHKQTLELEEANEKYLALAESKIKLEIVDRAKLSVLQIPDTTWDRPNVARQSWLISVPKSNPEFGSLHLAVDFVPQKSNSIGVGGVSELAKLLPNSQFFMPASPRKFQLPVGESKIHLEILSDGRKRKLRLLINETCIHELRLLGECDGSTTSLVGIGKRRDVEIGKPFSLVRWTPSLSNSVETETCIVRLLTVLAIGAEEPK